MRPEPEAPLKPSRRGRAGGRRWRIPVPGIPPGRRIRFLLESLWNKAADGIRDDLEYRRGFLWLPVAFAIGIGGYFQLPREPALVALGLATTAAALLAFAARRRPVWFGVLLLAAFAAAGATAAKIRTDRAAAPRLERPGTFRFTGRITELQARSPGIRARIRIEKIEKWRRTEPWPKTIVVTQQKKGTGLAEGVTVTGLARLQRPRGPALPGGYDFARSAYFKGIGAFGFVLGEMKPATGQKAEEGGLFGWHGLGRFRRRLADRIRVDLPGEAGAIAAALITGERRAIPKEVQEDLRRSGLAHILAISGLHMSLVAGFVFFALRALLAAIPGVALNWPIKQWAALAALAAGFVYLLLSGFGVATQRAFVMAAIAFGAILINRPALTMRAVALAALVVMIGAPETVLNPGFQMSFAAVIALIAVYEAWRRRERKREGAVAASGLAGRLARTAAIYVAGLAVTSLVAGLATAPIAAFHFYRLAPFGLLANVLAMPVVGFWIMPLGLVAVAAMPFGLDPPVLHAMGIGIDWLVGVARYVATLTDRSGLVGQVPAFVPLTMGAGLLWLALWRSRVRWAGAAMIALPLAGLALSGLGSRRGFDILVSESGWMVAARQPDGTLSFFGGRGERLSREIWLRADADGRSARDKALFGPGRQCDELGCILTAAGKPEAKPRPPPDATRATKPTARAPPVRIARVTKPLAFARDCREADIVVTPLTAPDWCARTALVFDRDDLRSRGAATLRLRAGKGPRFVLAGRARPRIHRPWH